MSCMRTNKSFAIKLPPSQVTYAWVGSTAVSLGMTLYVRNNCQRW